MTKINKEKLLKLFEWAYREFHSKSHRNQDPLDVVHTYKNKNDQELAAFYGALLAYGNVATIISSLKKVLLPLNPSLYHTLLKENNFNHWPGFKHRFTTGEDIQVLSYWIGSALKSHGSLETFFNDSAHSMKSPMRILISDFVSRLWKIPLPKNLSEIKNRRERNLKYLLSNPEDGSACKRLNMFFRWVVRKEDGIDLGLWKSISPDKLMLPIDTHLLKVLKQLKWTKSDTVSWKTVEETTQNLRQICSEDPLKYDFALCHLGISGKKLPKEVPIA